MLKFGLLTCPDFRVFYRVAEKQAKRTRLSKQRRAYMDKIKMIKWTSTAAVLTGIALTNLNIYPVNIMIHGAGATGWTIAGFLTKDRALLTNFCLQLPLFIFGIMNFFLQG